jgi:transposase InsO family protein
VGRLRGTEGAIWQLTAIDIASSFAWAELVVAKQGNPTARQTSKLARRVATDLKAAGWRLERVLSDNGNEFKGDFNATIEHLKARHTRIHAGRPQTNGNVEALHKTILDECWRPAFARYLYPALAGLRRELDTYLAYYNHDRVHHGRLTQGQIPADIVYGARKMETR